MDVKAAAAASGWKISAGMAALARTAASGRKVPAEMSSWREDFTLLRLVGSNEFSWWN